jgi:hypothetical protein
MQPVHSHALLQSQLYKQRYFTAGAVQSAADHAKGGGLIEGQPLACSQCTKSRMVRTTCAAVEESSPVVGSSSSHTRCGPTSTSPAHGRRHLRQCTFPMDASLSPEHRLPCMHMQQDQGKSMCRVHVRQRSNVIQAPLLVSCEQGACLW